MGDSRFIKRFVAGISALLLAGCVTYYPYPERVYSASDNSTQYYDQGEDSQGYDSADDATVVYGSTYYYPWWSVDYFYLGSHYYRPSLSFSFSFGSPWYSPYYGYYGYPHYNSPWHSTFYGYPYAYYGPQAWWGIGFSFGSGYGYGWNDPYWYHRFRGHDHYRYGHRYYGHYGRGYAEYGRGYGGYGRGHGQGSDHYQDRQPQDGYRRDGQYAGRHDRGERNGSWNRDYRSVDQGRRGQQAQIPTDRRVSVAPAGAESDRGMVVVNRGDAKPRENRLQPIVSTERQGEAIVREPGRGPEAHTEQQGSMRVVQPGQNKQGRSRTGMPVYSSRAPGGPDVIVNQPSQHVNQSRPNQPVVRMPVPDRRGPAAYAPPSQGDGHSNGQPRGQANSQPGNRAPEYARSYGGGSRESRGGDNRESHGNGGYGQRGEHGGRGRRDRD